MIEMDALLIIAYLFILGAVFGSFAGAVAWRLYKKRDFVKERSECEHCQHTLAAKDLLPVVSWLWLKGRCRYCKAHIGYSALLLEVGLGLAFIGSYIAWPFGFSSLLETVMFMLWLVALVCFAILFIYDLRHYLLPDKIMLLLLVLSVGIFVLRMWLQNADIISGAQEALLAMIPVTGVYGSLYLISKGRWIGLGDVKLGVIIGLLVGWQGALAVLLLSNLLGTAYLLPGMALGKVKRTQHIPFGPFLIVATYIVFFWGEKLISAYKGFFFIP